MNKAVFLDRDGVIVRDEVGYVHKVEDFKFETNALEGLKKLNSLDAKLIIITNQAGIAKRKFSENDYHVFNNYMLEQLKKEGLGISAVYYCPHHPDFTSECECRKPNPGMLYRAAKEHDIDLTSSYMIGDKTTDIAAGKNAGTKTILIQTGEYGDKRADVEPDYLADDLLEAAKLIENFL